MQAAGSAVEQVLDGNDGLHRVEIVVAPETNRGNQRDVHGFFGPCLLDKYAAFVAEVLGQLFCERIYVSKQLSPRNRIIFATFLGDSK